MNKKYPKLLEKCPIIDSLIEIRFESKVHPNTIFGIIYSALEVDFKKIENLPILQLPEAIRMSDPNLKYKPLYRISNKEFVIQIGSDVITIGSFPNYVGWTRFLNKTISILTEIENLNIIKKIERFGLRYINFFDENIFDNIKLDLSLQNSNFKLKNTVVRTEITQGVFSSTLQITNNASVGIRKGSIIDIDTHKTKGLQNFFKEKKEIINEAHQKEKELFFSLLREDFINRLEPKY